MPYISLRQNWFYYNIFMEWIAVNLHPLPYDSHHISLAIWSLFLLSLDVWRPWKLHWDVSEVARSWFWAWLPQALCFHLPGVKTTVPLSQCKWQTYYPVCYILIALSHWFQSNSLYSIIVTIDNYIQNLLLSFISL